MKKKLSVVLLAGLATVAAVAMISSTVAWFIPAFKLYSSDNEITGATEGAY